MKCVNCGEPIRPTEDDDFIDQHDGRYEYVYVHDNGPEIRGNPICDLTLVASPGGDGNGPAPVTGYLIDGKLWHPSDVTIVRQGKPAPSPHARDMNDAGRDGP